MKRTLLTEFLLITLAFPICGLVGKTKASQQNPSAANTEMRFVSPINGWTVLEDVLLDFEVGTDKLIKHGGQQSAYIRSKDALNTARAAVLRQSVRAEPFRGQRIRLSGWLKSESVKGWAGLWLRVEGEQGSRLSLDNMQNRPIKNTTDWQHCELVLEVPTNALAVSFGMVLADKGQAWMDDLQFEKVSREIATTEVYGQGRPRSGNDEYNRQREAFAKRLAEELANKPPLPVNLDFETPKR